jgi:Conjugal transfer protein
MKFKNIALLIVLSIALPLRADSTARTILYHAKDIVNIRAKVKYTTLIQLPATEKIIEAATGDKEFWIIDVVGNFCFVHPTKKDIRSNLNLITDKGNIYSFTLEDVSDQNGDPDLDSRLSPGSVLRQAEGGACGQWDHLGIGRCIAEEQPYLRSSSARQL